MKLAFRIKNIINLASNYRYHLSHKQQAYDILNNIESIKGKLDPKIIRLSDEYAKEVLGWRGYAPWLYVYGAMTESFKEGWIPDNYYGKVVVPAAQGDYGNVSNLKLLAKKLFGSDLFPDICYFVNGLWLSNRYEVLGEKVIKNILFNNSEVVVFKVDNSLQGRGVFFFDKTSFDTKIIQSLGNGVFQDYITQHQFFDELISNSVATLRITSILDDRGVASVRACYLRVGRNADTHVKSASQIRIPIDLASGELDAKGYLTNWLAIDKHPDTKVVFAGRKIPGFGKCISTVIELHKAVPYVRCIGWDVIIDRNNNVKLMEWNGRHNGITFTEATQGPCFADLGWEKIWRNSKIKTNPCK